MFSRRDFEEQMEISTFGQPMFIPNQDFDVVGGDSGRDSRSFEEILDRTPLTAMQKENVTYERSLKRELYNLENSLSEDEYNSYLKVRNKLETDSEKIYYLRLGSTNKNLYLKGRGIVKIDETRDVPVKQDMYSQMGYQTVKSYRAPSSVITLGMDMQDVKHLWGEPWERQVAGDPRYGNERWAYRKMEGQKYIYFSNGKVEGWSEQ